MRSVGLTSGLTHHHNATCHYPCGVAGNSDMLQKMNGIREMQEKLTLKHFEIDQVRINQER